MSIEIDRLGIWRTLEQACRLVTPRKVYAAATELRRGRLLSPSPTLQSRAERWSSPNVSFGQRRGDTSYIRWEMGDMAEGTIKRLTDKGFGFIDTGGGKDIFFHHSALVGVQYEELQEGQRVSFDEGRGPKGPRAENVKLI